jgi:hypothetical protein
MLRPEDGGSIVLRNVCFLQQQYTASHPEDLDFRLLNLFKNDPDLNRKIKFLATIQFVIQSDYK